MTREPAAPTLDDHESLSLSLTASPHFTPEGQALLEQAKDTDLATAIFRNRVIHPEQYNDEEQVRTAQVRAAVPARTRRRWQQWYREAETTYGNGFLGLLPQYHNCGGNRKMASEVIDLIHQVLETHYDTVRRAPKRGAYGEYLKCSEERALKPVSQWTFYLESRRHKAAYDTMRHPALGMTPRQAYERSIECDGLRAHKQIPYDETFRMVTFPTTRKGSVKVIPGVGVRINHLDYWCEAMRDPMVEGTQIQVRYDPFDVSVGFAYIDHKWRKCDCPYTEFTGCSERELQLLAEELRKRNRITSGRAHTELTQKQLATFRRENVEIETLLRQQRHDRETRAALTVLEGGKKAPVERNLAEERGEQEEAVPQVQPKRR